jgi:hypothetical protein
MRTSSIAVSTLLALALAAPARAQTLETPRRRQGYYVTLGLALAYDHNWQDGVSQGTLGGSLLSLRLGQLVTRRFGLGLRLDSGGAAKGPRKAQMGGLAVEAQWELVNNLAVHGTAGLGVVSLTDDRDDDGKLHGVAGAGYTVWLSYDKFFGQRRTGGWALAPMAGVRLVPSTTATALVGLIGLDFSWWSGLPREQLLLPPNEAW